MRMWSCAQADAATREVDIVKTIAFGAKPNLAPVLIFSLNTWVILGELFSRSVTSVSSM